MAALSSRRMTPLCRRMYLPCEAQCHVVPPASSSRKPCSLGHFRPCAQRLVVACPASTTSADDSRVGNQQGRSGRPDAVGVAARQKRQDARSSSSMQEGSSSMRKQENREGSEPQRKIKERAQAGGSPAEQARMLTAGISNCASLDALCRLVKDSIQDFDHIHVSTALLRASRMTRSARSGPAAELVHSLKAHVLPQLGTCKAQALANMLSALAKLGDDCSDGFVAKVAQRAEEQLPEFTPLQLCNTASALAALSKSSPGSRGGAGAGAGEGPGQDPLRRLSSKVWAQMGEKAASLNARDVATALVAASKMGYKDEVTMQRLLASAPAAFKDANWQDLADSLNAVASLGYEDRAFMELVVGQLQRKLRAMDVRGLANAVAALSQLQYRDAEFMGALVKEATGKLGAFNPRDIATIALGVARLGYKPDEAFVEELLRQAEAKRSEFGDLDAAQLGEALRRMRHPGAEAWAAAAPSRGGRGRGERGRGGSRQGRGGRGEGRRR